MSFATYVIEFNQKLKLNISLPKGVEVMNPFIDQDILEISTKFYRKFYSEENQRILILGINPGRFGGGITGIPFTDPVKLENSCGIANQLKKITEPSAGFIYDMIEAYGGPELFYSKYFIHAVCPLGFTKSGINYNYYDSKPLEKAATPFIIQSLMHILSFPITTDRCYCLGNGKNFTFLSKINDQQQFFQEIIPLPHPRWIVQYQRKKYGEFVREYLEKLG